ncbi:hypothetical protein FBR02_06720 [Anaerolineae bacterium CFX9]|nr:hypothetical protein [Chloroflexota bacterium]MDL1900446.1 hypothetical protein [Anaerolineae bacterium CFX9]
MTQDPNTAAMQQYHDRFDNAHYTAIAEFVASNLNADRDDERVIDLLVAVQNAAFELCGHSLHAGAWHTLAVRCGQHFLSSHTVDAIRDFLRLFAPDDVRIDDFEATAKAMLRAYSGLDDLKTATAHANGVHSWQGRMAYELLAAVDYLTHAAILLLAHEDDGYIREKLHKGLNRVTGGLYEGIRHSPQPEQFSFRSIYFPTEKDRF